DSSRGRGTRVPHAGEDTWTSARPRGRRCGCPVARGSSRRAADAHDVAVRSLEASLSGATDPYPGIDDDRPKARFEHLDRVQIEFTDLGHDLDERRDASDERDQRFPIARWHAAIAVE